MRSPNCESNNFTLRPLLIHHQLMNRLHLELADFPKDLHHRGFAASQKWNSPIFPLFLSLLILHLIFFHWQNKRSFVSYLFIFFGCFSLPFLFFFICFSIPISFLASKQPDVYLNYEHVRQLFFIGLFFAHFFLPSPATSLCQKIHERWNFIKKGKNNWTEWELLL